MDHLNPSDNPHPAPPPDKAQQKDPVCGMAVNPATSRYKTLHNGKEYFFCSAGCLAKFQASPEKILSSPPQPMGSEPVSLGGPTLIIPTMDKPTMGKPTMVRPTAPNARLAGGSGKDTRAYICPMCPEVRQIGPGPCPKCGMALEPESPASSATKTEYICPMHPQIVRAGPGSCPICGMALEPRTVTVEEDNPELRDMTRRFWISLTLTAPLLAIAMGSMLSPHAFMASPWNWGLPWLELLLATPVVLWCGWPFFQRGWASVVNRSTNMFTLIAMGTSVAYVYSVVATLFPGIFPASFREMSSRPAVYFEAAAAIVTLVLLGQVLELRARSRTGAAIRALLNLAPRTARVLRDSAEVDVPLDQVKVGD